jgi:HK97 gp10 family phage protein
MSKSHELESLLLEANRSRVAREFESLEAFALHIVMVEAAWRTRRREALNEAAKIIKEDAREQIGEYQPAAGNYPAWEQLAESTEDEKARVGAPPDAPLYRFGDLQKSFRSTLVGHNEVIVGSTDPNMDWHEFGTDKMPPRPVLGPALFKNIEDIRALLGAEAMDTIVSGQRMGYRFSAQSGGIAQPEEDSTP